MTHRTRYMRVALPAALVAAALAVQVMSTDTTASAGPRPVADGLLPSIPGVPLPPVPSVTLPPLPLPTGTPQPGPTAPVIPGLPGVPGLPALPGQPGGSGQPGQGGQPGQPGGSPTQPPTGPGAGVADPDAADVPGVMTADGAAGVIAADPGADLYPQPRVDPATTPQSRVVAQLAEAQHRVQYLRNVLTRTRADLTVAQAQLDAAATLITLLTAPGAAPAPAGAIGAAPAPAGEPIDGPQQRVLALSAAIASGEADLTRNESAVQTLQQQVNSGVQTTLASGVPAPGAPPPTGASAYGGGRLRRPVPGRITSGFGNRFDPYYHVWQLHAGLDMAAAMGTEIVAAAAGRVTRAGWNGGYGNYTCIDHGQFDGQRLTTCYGHQSTILVRPGQQVGAGEVIGRVGSTGASTGPHVHFEVRLGGRPVDPMPWI